jgi:hypothetical protein
MGISEGFKDKVEITHVDGFLGCSSRTACR